MTGWLLSATALVAAALVLRRVLRRHLHPTVIYALWLLAAARLLTAGELQMCSGARIPIPRGREGAVREAFRSWIDR